MKKFGLQFDSKIRNSMKVVIRFADKEEDKALPILLRHSPGMILPNRTYIISEKAVRSLRKAGVKYTVIARDGEAPINKGAKAVERI